LAKPNDVRYGKNARRRRSRQLQIQTQTKRQFNRLRPKHRFHLQSSPVKIYYFRYAQHYQAQANQTEEQSKPERAIPRSSPPAGRSSGCADADEKPGATRTWRAMTGQTAERMKKLGVAQALHPDAAGTRRVYGRKRSKTKGFEDRRVRTPAAHRVFQSAGRSSLKKTELRELRSRPTPILPERKEAERRANQTGRANRPAARALTPQLAEAGVSAPGKTRRCARAIVKHLGVTLARILDAGRAEKCSN